MLLRPAEDKDAEAIAAIYNHAVLHTTAIWNDKTVDAANRVEWLSSRKQSGFPVIVAVSDHAEVIGYAAYGDWRPWEGYRHTVEHSVYVHPSAQGQGVGRKLMAEIISLARQQGKHVMVAGIESTNIASIRLHEMLGFTSVGHLHEVGCKSGKWLDLTFMQLRLNSHPTP